MRLTDEYINYIIYILRICLCCNVIVKPSTEKCRVFCNGMTSESSLRITQLKHPKNVGEDLVYRYANGARGA